MVGLGLARLSRHATGLLLLALCGGPATAAENVMRLTARTPHGGFNRLVVSVTICAPSTSRCATIDDVMLDTGSAGLRLEGSAVPRGLDLPPFVGLDGRPLAECLRFVADAAWGPLLRADVHLGGMTAANLPIQIIDDEGRSEPDTCPHSTVHPTSNGTLGLGPDVDDCRGLCRQSLMRPLYYSCEAGRCTPLEGAVDRRFRLPNPIARLPRHNNGAVFDLPPSPAGGADAVVGTLTLGVGTAENNRLEGASVVPLDANGHFSTLYGGAVYPDSYIDSGTETYVVPDDGLPRCAAIEGAFCVAPERRLQAAMVGQGGVAIPTPFWVGDYAALLARPIGASDSMAVPAAQGSTAFVWGAPFFLGKRVSVVMDGKAVPGAPGVAGPLYAYGILPRP